MTVLWIERDDISLYHLDGANFGRVQGVRREPGQCIVTDERRGNQPKGARPSGVVAGNLSDCVALFVRATSPPGIRLLAEKLPATIKAVPTNVIPLSCRFPPSDTPVRLRQYGRSDVARVDGERH